jgi:diguanylate cyclase (GGDEF)-like protein
MEIAQPDSSETTKIVLNCSPILDGYNNARGCMVIFTDVTALHRANRKLLATLDELAASKEIIEEKNRELEKLATRDPMTGCLNRRALFDAIEPTFAKISAVGGDLCCIMGDIDHFKRFNDTYGHSVGDLVIKSVARCMGFGLRDGDLLCRYGGEEFCIFLPGVTVQQAWSIAERMRSQVENEAGRSIRDHQGLQITSSFGLASIRQGAVNVAALIDLADEALYHSKKSGRNQVTIWSEKMYEVE